MRTLKESVSQKVYAVTTQESDPDIYIEDSISDNAVNDRLKLKDYLFLLGVKNINWWAIFLGRSK